MAEKEVQNSKSASVSAVTSGKKASSGAKPSFSNKVLTNESENAKKDGKDPPLKEVLEILRVLNKNVTAQNERMDKQDKRLDEMVSQINETSNAWSQFDDLSDSNYDYDQNYDYDESQSEGNLDQIPCEDSSSVQPKSVFKLMSDKFNQADPVDAAVHPDLASFVNNAFRNGLLDDKYDELSKEIHRPENCNSLVKTRVNQGIWRLLKSWTQSDDSKLASLQGVLVKASVNVVKLVEKLGSTGSVDVELGTTAIALLGHAYKLINSKRKDMHKTDLDSKYHYLASSSLPYTDLLYGDDNDVNNNVREINTMNRIGKTVGRFGGPLRGQGRSRRARGAPYSVRGPRGRGRGGQSYRAERAETAPMPKNYRPQKKQ